MTVEGVTEFTRGAPDGRPPKVRVVVREQAASHKACGSDVQGNRADRYSSVTLMTVSGPLGSWMSLGRKSSVLPKDIANGGSPTVSPYKSNCMPVGSGKVILVILPENGSQSETPSRVSGA